MVVDLAVELDLGPFRGQVCTLGVSIWLVLLLLLAVCQQLFQRLLLASFSPSKACWIRLAGIRWVLSKRCGLLHDGLRWLLRRFLLDWLFLNLLVFWGIGLFLDLFRSSLGFLLFVRFGSAWYCAGSRLRFEGYLLHRFLYPFLHGWITRAELAVFLLYRLYLCFRASL